MIQNSYEYIRDYREVTLWILRKGKFVNGDLVSGQVTLSNGVVYKGDFRGEGSNFEV